MGTFLSTFPLMVSSSYDLREYFLATLTSGLLIRDISVKWLWDNVHCLKHCTNKNELNWKLSLHNFLWLLTVCWRHLLFAVHQAGFQPIFWSICKYFYWLFTLIIHHFCALEALWSFVGGTTCVTNALCTLSDHMSIKKICISSNICKSSRKFVWFGLCNHLHKTLLKD